MLGLLALSAILIPIWIRVELHQREPLVDVRMLAIRPVAVANMTAILAGFSMYAAFVAIPQFVQAGANLPDALQDVLPYGFAGSATEAGLVLLPGALMGLVIGPLAGRLGMRYGFIVPNVLGMVVASIGLAMLATFHDEVWQVVLGMLVTGAGIPFTFAAMAKLVVDAVRPQETAVATGMNTVARTIGGVIGGQILAVFLTSDTIGRTGLPAESAYTTMFWLCSAAAALAAVLGVGVPRPRPAASAGAARRGAGRGGSRGVSGAAREHTHDLLEELRTLYSQLARRAGMPESTLTMTQKLALMELVRMEPLRLGELADHIGVSDPTASRAVEALVVGGPRGAHPRPRRSSRRPARGDGPRPRGRRAAPGGLRGARRGGARRPLGGGRARAGRGARDASTSSSSARAAAPARRPSCSRDSAGPARAGGSSSKRH